MRRTKWATVRWGPSTTPTEAKPEMRSRIAVVGAGSWGTALANLLATNGHSVTLWSRGDEVADLVNRKHENSV